MAKPNQKAPANPRAKISGSQTQCYAKSTGCQPSIALSYQGNGDNAASSPART
jgi:hypothetical protein